MDAAYRPPRALNILLWIVQLLLAAMLLWAAYAKWSGTAPWPWVHELSPNFVRFTALTDLLGALGLVLPALLRIQPKLTPIAALGVVLLMVCASAFHIMRGESSVIGFNVVVALLALFVAWGRFGRGQIAAR